MSLVVLKNRWILMVWRSFDGFLSTGVVLVVCCVFSVSLLPLWGEAGEPDSDTSRRLNDRPGDRPNSTLR